MSLFLWPELSDHSIYFCDRIPGSPMPYPLEVTDILRFESFFSRLHHHPAFDPHINPLGNTQ